MATCKDCLHDKLCSFYEDECGIRWNDNQPKCALEHIEKHCTQFKDRSRFVELTIASKIKHTPDIEIMREFHKLGLGKGMGERSIFWTCSNCELWVSLAHKYCPNCGAKFEAERAFKEREKDGNL